MRPRMVRFSLSGSQGIFENQETEPLGSVHRLWQTLDWTVGSVQNSPVLVQNYEPDILKDQEFLFLFVNQSIHEFYIQLINDNLR